MDIQRIELAITKRAPWVKGNGFRIGMLLAVILASVLLFVFRGKVSHLGSYGYAGAFLISLLSSATVLLPVPGMLLVITMATILNPIAVGVLAGVGSALGASTAYYVGYSGAAIVKPSPTYQRAENWMRRHGAITVFVLSLVPNPVFDIAGILAGVLRMSFWKFLLASGMGNIIKFCAIALAATYFYRGTVDLFRRFFH